MAKIGMVIKTKKISDLKPAPYNPRTSTKKQEDNLAESLKKFGVVEPIIFNETTGHIVGGHFRVRELKKLGYKEVECVIVELSETDEKELNIRLNANTGAWDFDELANNWNAEDLEKWGFEMPEFGKEDQNKEEDTTYTKEIKAPTYEPKNEKPPLKELFDEEKAKVLIKEIMEADISKEDKEFLIVSAKRHTVFNYSKIADYYANSDAKVQDLMEKSALVIIDFDKAIENGYVQLTKEISDLYGKEYGDEDEK
jgi:hypothetical protein